MKKRIFILLGVLMMFFTGCFFRQESSRLPIPKHQLKVDSVIWLTGLQAMQATEFLIPVENVSEDTIRIRGVETFCDCLQSDLPKSWLAPHDTASLRMKIKPPSSGYIERKMQIYIGEDNRTITVTLKGRVKSMFK